MHTFFINTSGKELGNYSEILEIQKETRELVALDYPLDTWLRDENYKTYARKMGEMIDSYRDIGNDYNLIIYFDLIAVKTYAAIGRDQLTDRLACTAAMELLLRHCMQRTLLSELIDAGRTPHKVVLVFEKNRNTEKDPDTEKVDAYMRSLLGLPSGADIQALFERMQSEKTDFSAEAFAAQLAAACGAQLTDGLIGCYKAQLAQLFEYMQQNHYTDEEAVARLCENLRGMHVDANVISADFITNRRADTMNTRERARRDLRLSLYLLCCLRAAAEPVEDDLYEDEAEGARTARAALPVKVPEITETGWGKISAMLHVKAKKLSYAYQRTEALSDSYSKLKLAPELSKLDYERFALDEFGKAAESYRAEKVEESEDERKAREKQREEGVISDEGTWEIKIEDAPKENLLGSDYAVFEDTVPFEGAHGKVKPKEYARLAKDLYRHHRDYLDRLHRHVTDRMANYAGRSAANKPALLTKRKVYVDNGTTHTFLDTEDKKKRCDRYGRLGRDGKRVLEDSNPEAIVDLADTAYETTEAAYVQFCANRSVAVNNIKHAYDAFTTKMEQIQASLSRLHLAAIGLFLALIVLYLPFLAVQWPAIMQNTVTMSVAACGFLLPVLLLYVVFGATVAAQHKRFGEAWSEFEKTAEEARNQSNVAAAEYDQLLTFYVPALRWVYEYKLDAAFYNECCRMAEAKLAHHKKKMKERINTLGNIIEDLDCKQVDEEQMIRYEDMLPGADEQGSLVDYRVSFCTEETNQRFYNIFDRAWLDDFLPAKGDGE